MSPPAVRLPGIAAGASGPSAFAGVGFRPSVLLAALALFAGFAIDATSSGPALARENGADGTRAQSTHKPAASPDDPLPARLSGTGLYVEGSVSVPRSGVIPFSPQYPLWSDGTAKRRWIALPPGTSIDASQPDAWVFPIGTRLWKEFSHDRRIETRFIERLADGAWRYATYVWNAEGTDAMLVPEAGMLAHSVPGAVDGRYRLPSRSDCLACHEGPAVPVLGFSALQLSSDRDPLAPHAEAPRHDHLDLRELAARKLLVHFPQALVDVPPRIPAPTPVARAALGYLHGNCGHCHNAQGALPGLELLLAQAVASPEASVVRTLESLVGRSSRFRARDAPAAQRVVPGDASKSVITARMRSSNPSARMPPLGVRVVDTEGIALVERWIAQTIRSSEESLP